VDTVGHSMSGRKKRFWSDDEKREICDQATTPGISVAQVARRYAVNANLIHKWLSPATRDYRILPLDDRCCDPASQGWKHAQTDSHQNLPEGVGKLGLKNMKARSGKQKSHPFRHIAIPLSGCIHSINAIGKYPIPRRLAVCFPKWSPKIKFMTIDFRQN